MTGAAGFALSRPSAANSAPGRSRRYWKRSRRCRRARSCSSPRTSPPTAGIAATGGRSRQESGIIELVEAAGQLVERVRLLYLYPSSLNDRLIDAILATGVAYFDLSLQHASGGLLRKMRRYGDAVKFLERIERIRRLEPGAALRSSFIFGYPGETEEDHDELLRFIEEAELDWAGFFTFSRESGTLADGLEGQVPGSLALERLGECAELQEEITNRRRRQLVGTTCEVLVDAPGRARSYREAPEIDGIVRVPDQVAVGWLGEVEVLGATGPDLEALPVSALVGEGAPMKRQDTIFGPSALLTPANALTLARLLASPVLVALVITTGPSTWLLVALWFICSSSDFWDGVIARRYGTTRSGAFLDPLADKFIVLGVLASLAAIGEVSWLPVVLIGIREVSMSVFRSYAGKRGVSVPARTSAKAKTLLQDLVIGLAFLPPVGLHHASIVGWALWLVVAVTLWTGLEYLRDSRKLLTGAGAPTPGGVGRHVA